MTAGTKKRPAGGNRSGREVNNPTKGIDMNKVTATTETAPAWASETCPRCAGPLRTFEHDRGALSRAADVTVCGRCGSDEVYRVVPVDDWPVADAHKFAGPPPEIVRLLAELDAQPEGTYLILEPSDPLYREPEERRRFVDSDLRNPDKLHENLRQNAGFSPQVLGDYYNLDGTRVPITDRPETFWDEQCALTTNKGALDAALGGTNAVARLGESYIFVSRGGYVPVSEFIDEATGESGIEFQELSAYTDDYYAAMDHEKNEFVEDHPEIEEHRPVWAESVEIGRNVDGVREVMYDRTFEAGGHTVVGTFDAEGKFTLGPDTFYVYDYRGDLAGLEKFAADLNRMVETIKNSREDA